MLLFTVPVINAGATGAPAVPTLSHNQWGGDVDGDYDLTWNLYYGNNATSWMLYEKMGAGDYVVIRSGVLEDNTPHPQSGTVEIRGKTIAGTYTYYVELENAYGTSKSNTVSVIVGDQFGDILINGVDTHGLVNQFTINQGVNEFVLSFVGTASPNFKVETNNDYVLNCQVVNNNTLRLEGLNAGRAGLRITEQTTNMTRYVGVRVRKQDVSLPGMPAYVSVGSVSEDTAGDLNFWRDFQPGDKNKRMDVRYIYINGGPINGWRKWTTVEGDRARVFIKESQKLGMIPFFVYYNIPDDGESYEIDLNHIQSFSYMEAYYQDLRYFLEICRDTAGDDTVGIVFEPDFLGYMMQQSGKQPDQIMAQVSAAYSSGVLDENDPSFPNTVEGLVKSINYIVRKYYPAAFFGWQFNLWAYGGPGVPSNGLLHATETMGMAGGLQFIRDVAQQITDYYLRAGVASYGANFVSIDKYGLDGGALPGAAADPKNSTWFWNADLWNNYLEFVQVMHTRSNLPVILWQIPVGHINSSLAANPYTGGYFPDLDGSDRKYEDSAPVFFLGDSFKPGSSARFNYFRTNEWADPKISDNGVDTITWGSHMQEARDKGVISVLFGAGVNSSTDGVGSPPTDAYWWITKVQRYLMNPVPLSGVPQPTPTPTPSPTPTPTPGSGVQPWQAGVSYTQGILVSYQGYVYECIQSHTSLVGWEPPNVPALWRRL